MDTRRVAATAMNDKSSHKLCAGCASCAQHGAQVGAKKITRPRRSRANLVDLAECEKVSKSKIEGLQRTGENKGGRKGRSRLESFSVEP